MYDRAVDHQIVYKMLILGVDSAYESVNTISSVF